MADSVNPTALSLLIEARRAEDLDPARARRHLAAYPKALVAGRETAAAPPFRFSDLIVSAHNSIRRLALRRVGTPATK